MRKYLLPFLVFVFLLVSLNGCAKREEEEEVVYSGGIKVNLTEEEIQEAINWGAEKKDSEHIFLSYSFGGRGYPPQEDGMIHTKFFGLAYLGYRLARKHKSPEKAEIEAILHSYEEYFGIDISTYGDEIDFAKDYYIVLRQGIKIIEAVSTDRWADTTDYFPESPSYKATVTSIFPYSEIDPKGKTTIILVKDREESRFEVDFSRYK